MDPAYPSGPGQDPTPLGFEMAGLNNPNQPPPAAPVGFEGVAPPQDNQYPPQDNLYPPQDNLYPPLDNGNGPTPVEAPDYPRSTSGITPIGFDGPGDVNACTPQGTWEYLIPDDPYGQDSELNLHLEGSDHVQILHPDESETDGTLDTEGNTVTDDFSNNGLSNPSETYKQNGSASTEGVALLAFKILPKPDVEDETDIPEIKTEEPVDGGAVPELEAKRETLFFRDGIRRIDFVLAYHDSENVTKQEKRRVYEANLQEEGLELEHEDKKFSQHGKTHFTKIHAPWEVLTRVAELISIKMPIKEYDLCDWNQGCFESFPNPFEIGDDVIPPEPDYFTADFCRERENMFIINDKTTFFNNAQRSMIVYELLLRTRYEEEKDKFGIDRLVGHGVYTGAFPLHEGKYTSEHSLLTHGANNDRHLLYETWARPGRWIYHQPLDLIRKYFGEKVSIYFSWLGFYTMMLLPASIVGVIVFIYGIGTLFNNIPSNEICEESGAGNFTMCPLCDKQCSYWRLIESCDYSRLTYLFDNYATVFFAGFMSIWATMFLEFWKRKQAEIQYDWDLAGYEMEERLRPDFEAKCPHRKLNPVTQMMEPFLPIYSKIPRRCTSFVVILFMIACVLMAVFGVIMYRIIVISLLYSSEQGLIRRNAKITTTATAACINLVIIMLLNRLYQKVALWLTDLERPRTDTDYEDSFTFKMFLFQFINFYSSIFYIAFFKGRFPGHPGDKYYTIIAQQEECDPAGCLIELCIQLGIVMIGKQAFNNFKELMLPIILNWFRSKSAKKQETEENLYTRWEQDNDLAGIPFLGLFDEYLEMVIQYGFVTIFVAAFPLAPLFAFLNNIIEIRLDAYKFVTQWRRPVSQRAMDIGIWYGILQGVSFIAVLTNAFIIGWTSDFVPKMVFKFSQSTDDNLAGYINASLSYFNVDDFQEQSRPLNNRSDEFGDVTVCRYSDYRYPPWDDEKYKITKEYWHVFCARLAFVIVFEHAVFFLTWLVSYIIPDVPQRVRQLMLREHYLAKEARYSAAFATLKNDEEKAAESAAKLA